MSVDFYNCTACGEIFCDCGDFIGCDCGKKWCSEECANDDGFKKEQCKLKINMYDDKEKKNHNCPIWCYDCVNYTENTCNYCSGEIIEDYELLNFALKLLNIESKDELTKKYKESNE
ncbi:hypothetical protein KGF41_13905 [Clostridioides sp. ZZV14-6150]|uniref:hypothetical protein n=1 Tax=Clostridioides sp. ZZV14-6150 TaxID=2811493 RepID=UPI001D10DABA|nr:hypothetical protein [Clostridioides sp. ZZV14-6150]